jgi:hypothetical protein
MLLSALHTPSYAGFFVTGNDLLRDCNNPSADAQGRCAGYIVSVVDTHFTSLEIGKQFFCVPSEVNIGQLVDVAKKHLEAYPEARHLQAAIIVIRAFREAWGVGPCS